MAPPAAKVSTNLAPAAFAHGIGRVIVSGAHSVRTLHSGPHTVSPADLENVGRLIQSDKIKVVFQNNSHQEGFVANRHGAGYIALKHPGSTPMVRYRAFALHEATHATWMLKGGAYHINSLVDEALAFVAETMYLHKHGVLASELTDDPMLSAAYEVARGILVHNHATSVAIHHLQEALSDNGYASENRTYKPITLSGAAGQKGKSKK